MKYYWRRFMCWMGYRCPCHYLPTEFRLGPKYKGEEDGYYCVVNDRLMK